MSKELDAAETNWRHGDTRSAEYLMLQELKRLDKEMCELREMVRRLSTPPENAA